MKTSELTGALLDYWVARAEGVKWAAIHEREGSADWCAIGGDPKRVYAPSTNWAQGGPIIEREHGSFKTYFGTDDVVLRYSADMGLGLSRYRSTGPTYLVAAMRAYVTSKFGDEVDDKEDGHAAQA